MASIGTALALTHLHNELTQAESLLCIGLIELLGFELLGFELLGMSTMFTTLTTPGLTLLFLGVVVGLGAAFMWMFWEIEQTSKPGLPKREKARGHHRAPY